MVVSASHPPDVARIEAGILGVLLSAENTRDGAAQILQAIAPALDESSVALAARDRDGLTLHVLAERAGPRAWPATLEPQFALGSNPGVDAATGAYVVPLRTRGRVVGALLFGDPARAVHLVRSDDVAALIATVAAVLQALLSRAELEVARRGLALRSLDDIADGITHELANPLASASSLAELLLETAATAEDRVPLERLRQELARAHAVIADLQDFRRDTHAHDGMLDLAAVVERVVRFRGYSIRGHGITLEVDCGTRFLPVRADIGTLEHALHVVLDYAESQSHGRVNRRIGIRVLERDGGDVAVHVTDSGVGSVPEPAPACYDLPHVPGRSGSRPAPDLGFVASALRAFGGRLDIDASKTEGTTLALVLPRAFSASTSARRQPE